MWGESRIYKAIDVKWVVIVKGGCVFPYLGEETIHHLRANFPTFNMAIVLWVDKCAPTVILILN